MGGFNEIDLDAPAAWTREQEKETSDRWCLFPPPPAADVFLLVPSEEGGATTPPGVLARYKKTVQDRSLVVWRDPEARIAGLIAGGEHVTWSITETVYCLLHVGTPAKGGGFLDLSIKTRVDAPAQRVLHARRYSADLHRYMEEVAEQLGRWMPGGGVRQTMADC